jgi:hypothetical protein
LGVNEEKIEVWQGMLAKMPPYLIGPDGAVKEWLTPALDDRHSHRHASHLYPLYYGVPEEIAESPELIAGFKRIIEIKLDAHWRNNSSGFMSFGLVQLGQAATSLGEAELAYQCLKHLVNRYWLNNLASMHNHKSLFNMDISGGLPAVIIQMLVASEPGEVRLLPALPAVWPSGAIEGVLCRGQVEVQRLAWDGQRLKVVLVSGKTQTLKLTCPKPIRSIRIQGESAQVGETQDALRGLLRLPEGESVSLDIVLD